MWQRHILVSVVWSLSHVRKQLRRLSQVQLQSWDSNHTSAQESICPSMLEALGSIPSTKKEKTKT
jgi:hypothetical protein